VIGLIKLWALRHADGPQVRKLHRVIKHALAEKEILNPGNSCESERSSK
jgi:hypothetical protein